MQVPKVYVSQTHFEFSAGEYIDKPFQIVDDVLLSKLSEKVGNEYYPSRNWHFTVNGTTQQQCTHDVCNGTYLSWLSANGSEAAGDLIYKIRVNRLTGEADIQVKQHGRTSLSENVSIDLTAWGDTYYEPLIYFNK